MILQEKHQSNLGHPPEVALVGSRSRVCKITNGLEVFSGRMDT